MNLTFKLLLALLLTAAILIAAMAAGTHLSFRRGFIDYLSQVELKQLDPMATALIDSYQTMGDWHRIEGNHLIWKQFLNYVSLNESDRPTLLPSQTKDFYEIRRRPRPEHRQPPPPFLHEGDRFRPPPPPTGDPSALGLRLRLLDKDKQNLIGPPDASGLAVLRPLALDGEVIGYLSLTPLPWPEDDLVQQFTHQQLNTLYAISMGAFILALIVAFILGRQLIIPIRMITQGAKRLAAGKYDTKLAVNTNDELGQLTHDFNSLAGALKKNEALRRQAMADISHELRTPLSVLRAEVEAMQDGFRQVDQRQLQHLHQHIQGLSHLINDLYELALTDTGALSYKKEIIDISLLVESAVNGMQPSFTQGSIQLSCQVQPEVEILADERRIRQVVDNLLQNSLRYTDEGGTTEVICERRNKELILVVRDSSPGVAEDQIGNLFERFFRVESSRNRATGGSGLGLAICRNIILAHNGTIAARPSTLGGLEILVKLPVT